MNQVFIARPVGRVTDDYGATAGRSLRRLGSVLAYVFASTVGGSAVGLILAKAGHSVRVHGGTLGTVGMTASLTIVVLLAVGAEITGRRNPLPTPWRQVPRGWVGWRHTSNTAIGFGFVLGGGAFTILHHAAAYALAAVALLAPTPAAGALLGAVYGAIRGGMLLVGWAVEVLTGGRHRLKAESVDRHLRRPLSGVALLSFTIWVFMVVGAEA